MDIRNLLLDDLDFELSYRLRKHYQSEGLDAIQAEWAANKELRENAERFSQRIAEHLADIAMQAEGR